jgi:hypothetical protein
MRERWLYGVREEDKENLRQCFAMSSVVRERLTKMLENSIDKSLRAMKDAVKTDRALLTELYIEELAKQAVYEEIIDLLKDN